MPIQTSKQHAPEHLTLQLALQCAMHCEVFMRVLIRELVAARFSGMGMLRHQSACRGLERCLDFWTCSGCGADTSDASYNPDSQPLAQPASDAGPAYDGQSHGRGRRTWVQCGLQTFSNTLHALICCMANKALLTPASINAGTT